ncbi:MAG: RtcB family protein [Spirochaetaceae bacterium]|nr:MAG: RtcB family protein [Spirochaetaceae bacterium]
MEWEKKEEGFRVPIKSWCANVEPGALAQAGDLARHSRVFRHVALMPDCHQGYGMPIGGVIACMDAIIPNAVGVDIGCGMGAVRTNIPAESVDEKIIRQILNQARTRIPLGEGHAHRHSVAWQGFDEYPDRAEFVPGRTLSPAWCDSACWDLARRNLGTLGGGNHFIELQKGDDGFLWLMLHSGSRNLGYRIAAVYHKTAQAQNGKMRQDIPSRDLAFLETESDDGAAYIRDMGFALSYARENRRIMMEVLKDAVCISIGDVEFTFEANIHHNYAALETHFGKNVWVHRKGATSAKKAETGIIPGSMGTESYIVTGKGNPESFMSCSHGAGRKMGRMDACRNLSVEECRKAMQGIVYDGFHRVAGRMKKKHGDLFDLEEAPLAYKDIRSVIRDEADLVTPAVRLLPLGVLKG